MELTQELIKKAKGCKTTEELVALAQENGCELSSEDAQLFVQDFAEGELADEELDNVAGGGGCVEPPRRYEVLHWPDKESVQFIFNIGDTVEAFALGCNHHTATCRVTDRKVDESYLYSGNGSSTFAGYVDKYYLEKVAGSKSAFINDWVVRSEIEM